MGVAQAAALYDVSINAQDIVFDPHDPILNQQTDFYVTLTNQGERNVEGRVIFYVDGDRLATKAFSLRVNGRPEDVWTSWTPTTLGPHTIRVEVVNDSGYPDANPENNVVTERTTVDLDTDGDGVPNRLDQDQDNDGLTNEQEVNLHTDPLRRDTDGDSVSDKEDFYPLDKTRTRYEPPAPKTVPVPTTEARTTKPRIVTAPINSTQTPNNAVRSTGSEEGIVSFSGTSTQEIVIPLPEQETALPSSSPPIQEENVDTRVEAAHVTATTIEERTASSYRMLWGIAGATAALACAFAVLDWWQRRRYNEGG